MIYGIKTLGRVKKPVTWTCDSLEETKFAAMQIALKHHVDVLVFQIIGLWDKHETVTTWRDYTDDQKN